MKELRVQGVVIKEFGLKETQPPFSMLVSQVRNKNPQFQNKENCSKTNTQMQYLNLILPLDLISKDVNLSPYWNEQCQEKQSLWWLPHRTESPEAVSLSLDTLSNFTEGQSSFWKKTIVPKTLTQHSLSPISLPSATRFTEREVVKGTKKIRFYPKNEEYLLEIMRQQRRAYNMTIACFIESDRKPELRASEDLKKSNLRRIVREFVREEVNERGGSFRSADCDESVLSAFLTRDAVIKKRQKGLQCGFTFKSLKDVNHSFILQKLTKKFIKDNLILTEEIPEEAFGKLTRITFERGRWFICAQKLIETVGQSEIQAMSIVSLDPGVRDFMTSYCMNQSITYGNNFLYDRIYPKLKDLDMLYSLRSKCKNDQWKVHYQKRIDKLSNSIRDNINDLHKRVAFDLVSNYDIILIPKFETSNMVSKKNGRKLANKTVRSMLGLSHYKFQQHLQWMCKKYGKRMVYVNESYTSKTKSWNGDIMANLGSKRVIKEECMVIDRDINGARGIMLRALYGNSHR